MNKVKTGVIDVGGGVRGIYAAAIFDWCLDNGIQFDMGFGISAGSANLAVYGSGQRGRNYRFYTEYAFRKEYMSFRNYLRIGSYLDLDYVYGRMSRADGEDPLDYPALRDNPMELYVVAANANTGEVKYFDKSHMSQDNYKIFNASCAIPVACKPVEIDGIPYYDGAMGDPIPLDKAFELGCERVVLILSKTEDYLRSPDFDKKLAFLISRKYPKAAARLRLRAARYNDAVARAKKLRDEGKVLIIAPDDTMGLKTLTKDMDKLKKMYDKGYKDAEKIRDFIYK